MQHGFITKSQLCVLLFQYYYVTSMDSFTRACIRLWWKMLLLTSYKYELNLLSWFLFYNNVVFFYLLLLWGHIAVHDLFEDFVTLCFQLSFHDIFMLSSYPSILNDEYCSRVCKCCSRVCKCCSRVCKCCAHVCKCCAHVVHWRSRFVEINKPQSTRAYRVISYHLFLP